MIGPGDLLALLVFVLVAAIFWPEPSDRWRPPFRGDDE